MSLKSGQLLPSAAAKSRTSHSMRAFELSGERDAVVLVAELYLVGGTGLGLRVLLEAAEAGEFFAQRAARELKTLGLVRHAHGSLLLDVGEDRRRVGPHIRKRELAHRRRGQDGRRQPRQRSD